MTLKSAALSLALIGASCTLATPGATSGPTVPPEYLAPEWMLVGMDGAEVTLRATIDFSEPGRVSGQAPCNRWFAAQTADLPDFRIEAVGATRMACPDLAAEAAFFEALSLMTRAEITGPLTLRLTGPDGRALEFVRPIY